MHTGGTDGGAITDINVTPLVDVALVLVIIFMVTTPYMTQSKLSVTLPKAATDEYKSQEYVTITIDKDGDMSVNEKNVYTPKELEHQLRVKLAGSKDNVIIIKADLDSNHGVVIDAMDTAKKVKPERIYFATQQKKE